MIYIGNGIYSEATPNEYLQHYGVIGMKWGVHRARVHEKNLYRSNYLSGTMSRANAKKAYKERMAKIKETAKKNKHTNKDVSDIWSPSYNKAKRTIKDYDKKREQQLTNNLAVGLGLATSATSLGLAAHRKFNKATRNTEKIANGTLKTNSKLDVHRARAALAENNSRIGDDLSYAVGGLGAAAVGGLSNATIGWGKRNKSSAKKARKHK